jgi:hypothetical protein
MKISDLIKALEGQRQRWGDIQIAFYSPKTKMFGSFISVVMDDGKDGKFMGFFDEQEGEKFARRREKELRDQEKKEKT